MAYKSSITQHLKSIKFKQNMYFILILSQLLIKNHFIRAKDFQETLNLTTFLPYTLKTQGDKEIGENVSLQQMEALNKKDLNKHGIKQNQALSLYEENSKIIKPSSESNSWKRLTKFWPTPPTISKHQDLTYFCKTANFQYLSSALGSFNFLIVHIVFLLLHLGVLSYISFGGATLFQRLLTLSTPENVNNIHEDFGDHFYKSDL